MLHYFAFKTTRVQLSLADSETDQHKKALTTVNIEKPVFISGLPRAGTTILLDVLAKTACFSYHRYQDMPFIFTPMMWGKFSRSFAKNDNNGELTERAHKDGIKINQQSPEAFEEMLFKAFWPQRYGDESLPLWPTSKHPPFERFFTQHIEKLILRDSQSRSENGVAANHLRYLSKNNLNITRLPYLTKLFGDSILLLPFRSPVQHALSLFKQHQNFTQLHQRNRFAKDYMAAVGHFDFGANLKPVNFNRWYDKTRYQPDSLDFWLEYWLNCYQYLLEHHSDDYHFVCFENLCKAPHRSFEQLASVLAIDSSLLEKSVGEIKQPKIYDVAQWKLNSDNLAKSRALYQQLCRLAVNS